MERNDLSAARGILVALAISGCLYMALFALCKLFGG